MLQNYVSSLLFTAGNIAVEILLVTYLLKNASKTETANPDTERLRLATIVKKDHCPETFRPAFFASSSVFCPRFFASSLAFLASSSVFFLALSTTDKISPPLRESFPVQDRYLITKKDM